MALSRPDLRGYTYLRVDGLGGKRVATEVQPDGIIDSQSFERDEASDGDYAGAVIYRPNVPAQQQIREAGLTDGPKLFQTGALWADDIDLDYELCYLLHPYVINECIRQAPHQIYGEMHVPLTLWKDGDFSSPNVSAWDNGTIATPTKSSNPAYKFISNQRTLVVPASGGNLYAQSDDVVVEPGDRIFHAAIGSVEPASNGEAYYAIVDRTNNTILYENTFSSYRDQIVGRKALDVPANCHKIACRLGATANGVTTVWKALPSHFIGAGTTQVQSWLKEQMNLLGFGPARYGRSTGVDRYNAYERVIESWERHGDFELLPFVSASDYYFFQINRPGALGEEDYWIHGYRRMSDIEEELNNELASTNIDEEMVLTAIEALICERLGPTYREQAFRARAILDSQRIARPLVQPKPETGFIRLGLRR